MRTFVKDPSDIVDYTVDWSARLGADTIATSTFIIDHGVGAPTLVVDSDDNDATTTTVWLSGGTIDALYTVTSRITTAAGRQIDGSFGICIRQR